MYNSHCFHSHATKKEYKINFVFNCDFSNGICLTVLCEDFSMWVVLACLSGIDLITTRCDIVCSIQGLQFPRWTSSDISLRTSIMGLWKTFMFR